MSEVSEKNSTMVIWQWYCSWFDNIREQSSSLHSYIYIFSVWKITQDTFYCTGF